MRDEDVDEIIDLSHLGLNSTRFEYGNQKQRDGYQVSTNIFDKNAYGLIEKEVPDYRDDRHNIWTRI